MVNQLIGIKGEMILSHSETGWGPPSLWVKPKKSHCSSAWRGAGWWFEHQNHSQINSHWRFSRHVHLRREHELNANLISFYQTQDKTTFYKLLFAELLKAQDSCLKVKGKVQLTYYCYYYHVLINTDSSYWNSKWDHSLGVASTESQQRLVLTSCCRDTFCSHCSTQ